MKSKRLLRCAGRVLRAAVLLLITVLLVGSIYSIAAKNIFGQKAPTLFGFSSAVVLTGSMSGSIEPNDVVLTRKQDCYAVGDIITFESDGVSVTHRIVAIDGEGYRTKGDANNTEDALPAAPESVIGKVILVIPQVGVLLRFVRTPLGMLCFLGLTALLVELPSLAAYLKSHTDQQ